MNIPSKQILATIEAAVKAGQLRIPEMKDTGHAFHNVIVTGWIKGDTENSKQIIELGSFKIRGGGGKANWGFEEIVDHILCNWIDCETITAEAHFAHYTGR